MQQEASVEQHREQNKRLLLENELLKAKLTELEARLAKYENAHTPKRSTNANSKASQLNTY